MCGCLFRTGGSCGTGGSELVSFYQSGFQIHSMLCQMALHHLLCSRLVTHPDKNSQALSATPNTFIRMAAYGSARNVPMNGTHRSPQAIPARRLRRIRAYGMPTETCSTMAIP